MSNRKITDFQVVSASSGRSLEELVGGYMRGNWQPFGGLNTHNDGTIHIAMVKYEEEKSAPTQTMTSEEFFKNEH